MQELTDLLTDSKFWMALTALLRIAVPYMGVEVSEDVWLALDALILAILGSLAGAQVLRKRKERQCINVCCE